MKLSQPMSSQQARDHRMTVVLSAVNLPSPMGAYHVSDYAEKLSPTKASGTTDILFLLLFLLFLKTLNRPLSAAMARRMSRHLAAAATTDGPIRSTLFLANRAYGSAAAAVYDYYSEDEEYVETLREPRLGTEKSVPGRGVQWVIMGDRGAKKHLFAERLSKLLEVPHISMGSLVRQELNPRSSLYKKIASAVNESKLVPEDVVFALLSRRLEEGYYNGERGFILEGIPRTRMQAEILDQIADIDMVLNFKCSDEYTSLEKSSSVLRMKSQGEQLIHANLAWKEKFAFYAEQSKLLEDYYSKQRKLLNFEVTTSGPGETWKGLLAALHLQHMNVATDSPQKLTA